MSSATAEPLESLQGSQQPRISLVPEYVSSTGSEAIELAEMAGLFLDPWQQLVLTHSLGERSDGKWAAFEVGLCVGRQNGKNALLEARELAELFLVSEIAGPRTIVHSAHLFPTSLEHFRRLTARIRDTPELARKVKRRGSKMIGIRESHGEESIELVDGSRILFAARTKGGRRGFTLDLLVWDEAMELPGAVVGAVLPTVSAKTGPEFVPGPQAWYTGSAVNQANLADPSYGIQFTTVRERAIRGEDPALAYFEWSAPEDSDPGDPAAWALANPGLGIRITPDYVAREREAMPPSEFAVERLGIGDWPSTAEDDGRVISVALWERLRESDPSLVIVDHKAFAVDVNPDQTWAAVAVAGTRADGMMQIDVVEHEGGVDWVVPLCVELHGRFRQAKFVLDKRGPGAFLIAELRDARVPVREASTEDYRNACGGFLDAVLDRRFRYPDPQPALDQALWAARKAPMGDAWKWSRKNSTSADISPLVAVTLAHWAADTKKRRARVINLNDI